MRNWPGPNPMYCLAAAWGEYKYYDMDKVIESAMNRAEEIFG